MKAKTAIIIPGYNEEKYIRGVLKRVQKTVPGILIIMVNDGSSDKTKTEAQLPGVIVLNHRVNLGKGCAARTGCDYAYRQGIEQFVLIDADGQHEPEDIPLFIKALKNNDIVFGYREGGESPLYKDVGNWGLTLLTKIFSSLPIKDTQCGFRSFNKKAYRKVRWQSRSYGMESEMIQRARKLKYTQLPIKKIYLEDYKGTSIVDGMKIVTEMIRWRIFR